MNTYTILLMHFISALLIGCVAKGTAFYYTDKSISLDKTALIRTVGQGEDVNQWYPTDRLLLTQIVQIAEVGDPEKVKPPLDVQFHFSNYANARVLPGRYGIGAKCWLNAYPAINVGAYVWIDAQAGEEYVVQCAVPPETAAINTVLKVKEIQAP